jgi:hypothetical protein
LSLSLLHTLHSLLVALANFLKVVVQHRVSAWTDIIFDAFASAVIGASNAPAVSKQSENLRSRIFPVALCQVPR